LKALSNDIQRNLEAPLAGIRAQLAALGLPEIEIRTFVRTGDTPQHERARSAKRPPHIVVTTPESLYILLGAESGRRRLATTRPRARPAARDPRLPARGGDVRGGVDADLRPPGRARERAPHYARVRQHPAAGRAHRAASVRAARRAACHRPPRQHGEGIPRRG